MAMLYEPPTNVTDATQMISWINSTTSLWLFQGLISTLFIVTLISMLKNPQNTAAKCFAASSFVTALVAVFSRTLNLVPTWFMAIWIVLAGLSAIWVFTEGTQ